MTSAATATSGMASVTVCPSLTASLDNYIGLKTRLGSPLASIQDDNGVDLAVRFIERMIASRAT